MRTQVPHLPPHPLTSSSPRLFTPSSPCRPHLMPLKRETELQDPHYDLCTNKNPSLQWLAEVLEHEGDTIASVASQ